MKQLWKAVPFVALLAASAAFAQEPKFGEKIDVNTVLIDAVVTDARGNQILGISKDDFVVRENGVEQTVDSVDYFTNRRLLNDSEQAVGAQRVNEGRYFVLFFDKTVGADFFDRVSLARRAAQQFVEHQLQPGDLVAVAGHDVRLKVFSDFTSDRKQLSRALADASSFSRGITAANGKSGDAPSILANVNADKMMNGTGTTYEALTLLGDSLRSVRGRKNVVLFSPGIIEPGEDVRGGVILNQSRYYDPMVHALNAANVTVYPVQLAENASSVPALNQTLERVATETNGEYFRYSTNFAAPLKKVENATNGYYLISYRSNKPRTGRGYQHVDVSLRNPEFKVKAREGYLYGE
jgi:VWFA-related protein